jgi:hypothetical protein
MVNPMECPQTLLKTQGGQLPPGQCLIYPLPAETFNHNMRHNHEIYLITQQFTSLQYPDSMQADKPENTQSLPIIS